ncbi:AMP-dependent synthetase/ligase [Cordyceps fumosorosea ARSEF 2679]|uniref:AMP-dependent synthetase/ligase n=1 Tax=Cordyceps fumosorosea (strain ARSEF 2679) TaxID=1081104 RepID=A0A168B7G7_CORFA|nr:AMP-dependent synthetase/ligase [Cordyceps fumosorosea ARSEF 2679]OAA69728.1 AMP-dependent synthetase/ligase [Cordyceps fumosorosea ARSEF 2679]
MMATTKSTNADMDNMTFCFGQAREAQFYTTTAALAHFALTHPSTVAVRDLSARVTRQLTYGELARQAQALAWHLRSLGVQPGQRVPLVVKRSQAMIVAIFAVLLCGAQYVPLDGGVVPDATLRHVFCESGGKVLVCVSATEARVRELLPDALAVNAEEEYAAERTTGKPKGVDVTQANVANLVCQAPGNLGVSPGVRVGQLLNISFDMAAWEIFTCLCNGGTLVIRGSDWEPTMSQIDILICTPSILAKYPPQKYRNIKVAATAGEPTTQSLADLWAAEAEYWNCCGPTETTIVNTMSRHATGDPITIGRPTPNNNVYILDEAMRPVVGPGVTGIMWAGGCGVSRGYIGLEQKTRESYLPDPFMNDGSQMYRTGDLGQWDVSGNILILGRCDDQVKVKGFRVELDGVSSSLLACPGVSQAVALFIDGQIHAFVSPLNQDEGRILAAVAERQPYYAVPSVIHQLAAFPVTANGKTDKRALRAAAEAEEKHRLDKFTMLEKDATMSEKGTLVETRSVSSATTACASDSGALSVVLDGDVPEKKLPKPWRGLAYRIFIIYRTLFSFVVLLNAGTLAALLVLKADVQLLKLVVAANLALTVLVRQDVVINVLYTICCSVPKTAPLWIRRRCAKIYHLGGVHSAAGVCSTAWLLGSNISSTVSYAQRKEGSIDSLASIVVSWMVCALCCAMIGFAYPTFRKKYHNTFEQMHRFMGWTALLLFWIKTVLNTRDAALPGEDLGLLLVRSPAFWLLVVATCSIASSWMFLRKVPVETVPLSEHAAVLSFTYTVPVNGTFTRLSTRPLLEWHSFATIPQPEPNALASQRGYSLVVSNAGDWTKSCVQGAPRSLWVRGLPTCGVMRIATLFERVVVVATGSGIGPLLGHIQSPSCATQLIWSTKNPEKTFGKAVLDTIYRTIPDAVIHDTATKGRPDLVKMAYNLASSFRAEAVIVIANEKITKKLVYGLETRGVPAYGAIWDS